MQDKNEYQKRGRVEMIEINQSNLFTVSSTNKYNKYSKMIKKNYMKGLLTAGRQNSVRHTVNFHKVRVP